MQTLDATMGDTRLATFDLKLDHFAKQYPVVPAAANKNIGIVYLYDLNDNFALATQIAKQLSIQIHNSGILADAEVLVMPGDSANMLGTLLLQNLLKYQPNLKFCIIRASAKGGSYKAVEYQSLTSATKKTLHLRSDQFNCIANQKVIIFDDVVSSGATFNAIAELMAKSNANILAFACFATEGAPIVKFQNKPLFKLTHLPIVALG